MKLTYAKSFFFLLSLFDALCVGKLYCLQTRPIVTLPPSPFFTPEVLGSPPTLWDNSNIVESFAGVTSPLTFSFASLAYKEVHPLQFQTYVYIHVHVVMYMYMQ